jgi:hypothetical protein
VNFCLISFPISVPSSYCSQTFKVFMRYVFNMILHWQVEIGNYDSFYEKGVIFTPEQVKNGFQYSILNVYDSQ